MSTRPDTTTDLLYFDAFTEIGPRRHKHPAQLWKLEDLLAEMDHCSISGALVSSTQSYNYDAHTGNLQLSRQIASHDHLFPIWNVLPSHTGEFPEPAESRKQMEDHGVAAVTLHPSTNGWDWEADTSRDLLEMLEETRTPAIVKRGEFGAYRDLERFLSQHPRLPVILTGAVWFEQREVLPLFRKHLNLHLTFDHFQIHYGPEYFHAEGDGDRVLFASNSPAMSAGAHRCYWDYADIPTAAKQAAAGGNLIRLLKGRKPPRHHVNPDEDALMTAARHGQPLPTLVVDMHMHMLDDGLNGGGGRYRMERGGPSGVFPLLQRLGCNGGGFMSWNGPVSGDTEAGNESVRASLDLAPSGYWGLATFHPTHYSQEELKRLIEATYQDHRFIGMKPYCHQRLEYHHPSFDPWWEFGQKHGLYALIHLNYADYREIDALAAKYPGVRWVVAHCGANYTAADGAIEMMRKHPNVYAEITLTPVTLGIIEYLANEGDPSRVLYGSDLPMRDPRQQLGWVVFSRLPLAEKQKILGGNALDVINPCRDRLPDRCYPSAGLTA